MKTAVYSSSGFRLFLYQCLLALLGALFIWEQSSAFASTQQATNDYHLKKLVSQSSDNSLFHISFPFESAPTSQGGEDPDENEPENDFDDDFSFFALHFSSAQLSATATALHSNCFTQSALSSPNIPFFILYHSWKSFLS